MNPPPSLEVKKAAEKFEMRRPMKDVKEEPKVEPKEEPKEDAKEEKDEEEKEEKEEEKEETPAEEVRDSLGNKRMILSGRMRPCRGLVHLVGIVQRRSPPFVKQPNIGNAWGEAWPNGHVPILKTI